MSDCRLVLDTLHCISPSPNCIQDVYCGRCYSPPGGGGGNLVPNGYPLPSDAQSGSSECQNIGAINYLA